MSTSSSAGQCTYCPVPWNHLVVTTDGAFLSCMVARTSPSKGLLPSPKGEALRVGDLHLEEFRNHPALKEVRRNMLAGRETPALCLRCIDEERHGLRSRRQIENGKNLFTLEDARKVTDEDGTLLHSGAPLQQLNVRLGNFCNLACRGCGPTESTGWYEEWHDTRHRGFRSSGRRFSLERSPEGRVKVPDGPFDWARSEQFWKDLTPFHEGIREIHFSGGEPLLSVSHRDFLQSLVDEGISARIALDYNSNLTLLPDPILSLWEKFRRITVGVSLDGVGVMNDYIRYPSRFEAVEKNLLKLERSFPHLAYWVTSTLSAYNVGHYQELVKWILDSPLVRLNRKAGELEGDRLFSFHLLRAPEEISAFVLPESALELVEKRYAAALESLPPGPGKERARGDLRAILTSLRSGPRPGLLADFLAYTERSDNYRGQSFETVDPEFWATLR